jgi:hypothetical protein
MNFSRLLGAPIELTSLLSHSLRFLQIDPPPPSRDIAEFSFTVGCLVHVRYRAVFKIVTCLQYSHVDPEPAIVNV